MPVTLFLYPLAAFLLLASATTAYSQRVFVVSSSGTATVRMQSLATGTVEWTAADIPGVVSPVFTSDGRFIAYRRALPQPGRTAVEIRDSATGAAALLPYDMTPLLSHPRDLALLGTSADGRTVVRLDASGLSDVFTCPSSQAVLRLDQSVDGARLMVRCGSQLAMVDAATGSMLSSVSLPVGLLSPLDLNADGSRAVGLRRSGDQHIIELIDTATGAVVTSVPFGPAQPWPNVDPGVRLQPSPSRESVVATGAWIQVSSFPSCSGSNLLAREAALLAMNSLQVVRTLTPTQRIDYAFVSPDSSRLYAEGAECLGTQRQLVSVVDLESGAPLVPATDWGVAPTAMAMAFAPTAPTLAVPVIAGNSVRLDWALPAHSPAATGYMLEIGSSPGGRDIGSVSLGGAQTFSASGVPSGAYYVRVRAANVTGIGPVSNEVQIRVQ